MVFPIFLLVFLRLFGVVYHALCKGCTAFCLRQSFSDGNEFACLIIDLFADSKALLIFSWFRNILIRFEKLPAFRHLLNGFFQRLADGSKGIFSFFQAGFLIRLGLFKAILLPFEGSKRQIHLMPGFAFSCHLFRKAVPCRFLFLFPFP